jgi:uncharacterized membrane protein
MAGTAKRASRLDRFLPDRLLGVVALLLLAAVLAAIWRDRPHWAEAVPAVWAHLALLVVVLVLTPLQLWGRKGAVWHRRLGWIWVGAMMSTAVVSFAIRDVRDGGLSWIHLLSAWVLIQVPWMVWAARQHQVDRHRARARAMTIFALAVAGFFTFPFGRMLGRWLLG